MVYKLMHKIGGEGSLKTSIFLTSISNETEWHAGGEEPLKLVFYSVFIILNLIINKWLLKIEHPYTPLLPLLVFVIAFHFFMFFFCLFVFVLHRSTHRHRCHHHHRRRHPWSTTTFIKNR